MAVLTSVELSSITVVVLASELFNVVQYLYDAADLIMTVIVCVPERRWVDLATLAAPFHVLESKCRGRIKAIEILGAQSTQKRSQEL